MTIDEAIKELFDEVTRKRRDFPERTRIAAQLGIEALKVVKEFRTGCYKTINSPLLGETRG